MPTASVGHGTRITIREYASYTARYIEMTESDFIVEELLAIRPNGTKFHVLIRVGKPFKDGPADDLLDNTHVCLVECEGIDLKPLRVCGEGPMQALHLGLKYIWIHLDLAETDGLRFVWPGTEEPFDWRKFWFDNFQPRAE